MSWTWSIPIEIRPSLILNPPLFDLRHVRAVIPTFRDWEGARVTVESVLACHPRPAEIVLINDNHEPDPPAWVRRYPIYLVNYRGNRGPARARNAGVQFESGRLVEWLYFTDTGCERAPSFFAELLDASMRMPRTTVAVAAPVEGVTVSPGLTPINHYMTDEAILNPPRTSEGPQAIITANAAVSSNAFRAVGGFTTSYPFAAGEDLDLGVKLRHVGSIAWAAKAVVRHCFAESMDDFRRRFFRYGAGNAHLEHRMRLPSMRVEIIKAHDAAFQPLADAQVQSMQAGYDQHGHRLREFR